MKSIISFILFICLTYTVQAQVYFNKRFDYNSSFVELAYSVLTDSGFIYSGISTLWNDGTGFLLAPAILKFDSSGNTSVMNMFQSPLASTSVSGEGSLIKLSDGFLLAGRYVDSINTDILIIKTTFSGDTIWTRRFGGAAYQAAWQVQELPDGNYGVCGQKRNGSRSDMYLMKLDTIGNLLWDRFYGDSISSELALSFTPTIDNGFALAGHRSIPGPDFEIYIVKTDSMGIMQWDTVIGNQWDEEARSIISTSDGNLVIGGFLSSGHGSDGNIYICKLDLQGNLLWQKIYRDPGYRPKIYSVKESSDGSLIATGRIYGQGSGINGFIFKMDSNGDSLWCYDYFNSLGGYNELIDIAISDDGGFIACGVMSPAPPDTGNQDCWFLKVDSVGCEVSNCILSTKPLSLPSPAVNLYPNPFSNIIYLENKNLLDLTIDIFNYLGEKQITVNSNSVSITVNTGDLIPGVYFAVVWSNSSRIVYKLICVN